MKKRNTQILIANVSATINAITPTVVRVFEENNFDKKYISSCIDWCINEALFNVLLLSVIGTPRCHTYEIVYSRISLVIETHLRAVISFQDVAMFKDNSVKTICNGQDLYITTYHEYVQHVQQY